MLFLVLSPILSEWQGTLVQGKVGYLSFSLSALFIMCLNFRGYYTFLHELAHIFGATHDKDVSTNYYFRYGHGKLFKRGKREYEGYRTIMGYLH